MVYIKKLFSKNGNKMAVFEFHIAALVKNCNAALILADLANTDKHGYQLTLDIEEQSNGYFNFNHGTLYPILHKLEKEKLIKGIWHNEGPKRKRKYYAITKKEKDHLQSQQQSWKAFFSHFDAIVGGIKE